METTLADWVEVINLARLAIRLTVGALAMIALVAVVAGPDSLTDLANLASLAEPDVVTPESTETPPAAPVTTESTLPPVEATRQAKLAGPADLAGWGVAWTYGDDPRLDVLWRQCESGRGDSCDRLFDESPLGSDYERYGLTCGDRPALLRCEG